MTQRRTVPPVTRPHRPLAAAAWMVGSITGFSVVAIAGRELARDLNTFEIMFYRSAIGVCVVVGAAILMRQTAELRPAHLGAHLVRNLFHFAGQNLWLYALTLIPLAQLFAVEFSYPILVALAAPLFLGERLSQMRLFAAALGFAGILIVARPFGGDGLSVGLVTALLSAVGFAGAAIVTKKLTGRTSVMAILFWLTLMQAVFGLIGAFLGGGLDQPGPDLLPWAVAIGLGGLGAHLSLTMALSLAPASIVTPMDFLRLPVIGVLGMLWYDEAIDIWVFVGGAIIFAANWLNVGSDRQAPAPPSA